MAPGIDLGAAADLTGSLSGRGVDLIDLYRFRAGLTSELDLRLRMSSEGPLRDPGRAPDRRAGARSRRALGPAE